MKKIFLTIFLLIIYNICCSCSKQDETCHEELEEIEKVEGASTLPFEEDDIKGKSYDEYSATYIEGIESEVKYNKIFLETEKEVYTLEEEKIICTVKNGNKDRGFYLCFIPYVEYYKDNQWVRLSYNPPNAKYEERWAYCAIEGAKDREFSTQVWFFPEYLEEEFVAGKYRIIVIVGPNKYYDEFWVE